MKNKQILLLEYSYLFIGKKDEGENKAVDKKTFDEIESFILKNSDSVQYLKIGQNKYHKYIQAQNYVGIIQTKDGTTIEILPKISYLKDKYEDDNFKDKTKAERAKEILIKMLKTLKKSPFKNFNMVFNLSFKLY